MARIYVGTYAKYNDGNLSGEWLDAEDYADLGEFLEACRKLHEDEEDPELMFQDHEDCAGYVGESGINPELWDFLELDEDEREMVRVYREHEDDSADFDYIREAFQGKADSKADFAAQLAEDIGAMPESTAWPCSHIDWDSAARELEMDGYSFIRHEGELWVFRSH